MSSSTPGETYIDKGEDLLIGQASPGMSLRVNWNGSIDEVRIWNRSLSADEVYQQYASNLNKFNSTGWGLYVNQSLNATDGLADGDYTYFASAKDDAGNENVTETRTVTIDASAPNVSFVAPTEDNASTINVDYTIVNVSTADDQNVSTFIDFDNSLVGWWRMDDVNGSGDPTDYLGVNNGTAYGDAVLTSDGKIGSAFEFDGVGDYVNTGVATIDVRNTYTLAYWVNYNALAIDQLVGTRNVGGDRFYLGIDGTDTFFGAGNNFHYESDNVLHGMGANEWHLLIMTVDGSDAVYYVDAVQKDTFSYTGSAAISTSFKIGTLGSNELNFETNGSIDDVMIFNRSLSAEEIVGLYANSSSKYVSNNFTSLADGAHTFKAYSQDISGNVNETELRTVTYTAAVDSEYPFFSNITDNNGSLTGTGNVSISSNLNLTNGTAWVQFNNTNYSMSNSTDYFNVTFEITNSGIFSYLIGGYGNGSDNLVNTTEVYNYTINAADTTEPYVNFTDPTPANASTITIDSMTVNVSSAEETSNVSTFIDFDNSLVGWWRMDDVNGSGDPTDYLGVNNGTAVGDAVLTSDGKIGDALHLDGAGDYVDCGDLSNEILITSQVSYGLWIKLDSYKNYIALNSDNPGSSGNRKINLASGSTVNGTILCGQSSEWFYSTDSVIPLNEWTHVFCVDDMDIGYVYINGELNKQTDYDESSLIGTRSAARTYIGEFTGGGAWYLNGSIDDVMIFNRSLSADEIIGLYANTSSKYVSNNFTDLADGAHTFKAYAQDLSGNVNSTELRTVTYTSADTTEPYFTTIPANASLEYGTESLGVDFVATDAVGFDSYVVDDATNFSINASGYLINATVLAEGSYQLNITINDSSNNLNSTLYGVVVNDTTEPYVNFTDPTPANASTITIDSMIVNVTSTDAQNVSTFIDFDSSLVSWWRMDDVNGSGDPTDYLGVNNGTAVGDALINSTGKIGDGLHLDGAGDYVGLGDDDSLDFERTDSFSISGWLKTSNTLSSSAIEIMSKQNSSSPNKGWAISQLGVDSANTIRFALVNTGTGGSNALTIDSNTRIDDNIWHFFSITYDGSSSPSGVKIYLDGDLDDMSTDADTLSATILNDIPLQISGRNGANRLFTGSIDDVMIFNRSLSAEEIVGLYANSSSKYVSNNFTGLAEGEHTFKAYSQDLSGNVNETELRTVTYTAPDTTFPLIDFDSPTPANATSTTNTSVEINVSIVEANLDEVKYNWNGTNFTMLNDSLVLMMNFDNVSALGENDTHVVDVSSYGNNGTAYADAKYNVSGKYGGSFSFDGVGDYVNISDDDSLNLTIANAFTASFWVKTNTITDINSYGCILCKGGWDLDSGFELVMDRYGGVATPGEVGLSIRNMGGTTLWTDEPLVVGDWYHVVATWDGTNARLYQNGVNMSSSTPGETYIDKGEDLLIGQASPGMSLRVNWNGSIDEVRIWNRSLSADEVYQQYASNLNKFNSTGWGLYVNQSLNATDGLADGDYTYFASAKDDAGNENVTETRTVTIDASAPNVSFVAPTEDNASTINVDYTIVNVSTADDQNVSTFIDFDNSLVGWWRMDDVNGSGDPTDYLGVNNGTAYGDAVLTSDGKIGSAFEFDGVGDYVNTGVATIDVRNTYTLAYWVNYNALAIDQLVGTRNVGGDRFYLGIDGTDTFFGAGNNFHYESDNVLHGMGANEWHLLIMTVDGSDAVYYVDAVQKDTFSYTGSAAISTSFKIGTLGSNELNFETNGSIDDVMIFNRSLSAEEIVGLYANSSSKYVSNNFTSLADGAHTFKAYSQDISGNVNETELRTVTYTAAVDSEYPFFMCGSKEKI